MRMLIAYETQDFNAALKYGDQYVRREQQVDVDKPDRIGKISALAEAYDMMATSAIRLQKYESALEYCNRHLKIKPNSPSAVNNLAQATFKLGKHEQAFDIWKKLLQTHPDMAVVYGNMGMAYYQLGDLDQAAASLQQALKLNPGWVEARKYLDIIIKQKNDK